MSVLSTSFENVLLGGTILLASSLFNHVHAAHMLREKILTIEVVGCHGVGAEVAAPESEANVLTGYVAFPFILRGESLLTAVGAQGADERAELLLRWRHKYSLLSQGATERLIVALSR